MFELRLFVATSRQLLHMVASKKDNSIFEAIFLEGFKTLWLPIIFFLNIFLTGFLLPADQLEAGYNMHHWDFVSGIGGALSLFVLSRVLHKPGRLLLSLAFFFAGIVASFVPYLWCYLVLPHGIPANLQDKWGYAFSGPVAQIVGFALILGSVKYGRRISNSVAENRAALNIVRRDMAKELELERTNLVELILSKVTPALSSVESRINLGADRHLIASAINQVIAGVVRPLSHELDSSAAEVSYEIDRRMIKREFRKTRFRQRFSSEVPLLFAFNGPLSFFAYLNFNLITISYTDGFRMAAEIGTPFLAMSFLFYLAFRKLCGAKIVSVRVAFYLAIGISLVEAIFFMGFMELFASSKLTESSNSFAFTTFVLTLIPSLMGIALYNLRANLQHEAEITDEISKNLSIIRRQLWSLRKKFAREIHGGLQSKLQVLAIKFDQAEVSDVSLQDQFSSDIRDALTLGLGDAQGNDLGKAFAELAEFWSGVSHITVDIADQVLSSLSNDPVTADCIYEVVREAVTNAVKHSGAAEISISINADDEAFIQLEVSSNALKLSQSNTASSLGSNIFKELTHTWNLIVEPRSSSLTATFALNH